MRDIRQIVGLQGAFAVYENTSPEGEGSGAVASPVGSAETALDRSHARRVGRDHGTRPVFRMHIFRVGLLADPRFMPPRQRSLTEFSCGPVLPERWPLLSCSTGQRSEPNVRIP